eukprot:Gb_03620 [translate_table: standard]
MATTMVPSEFTDSLSNEFACHPVQLPIKEQLEAEESKYQETQEEEKNNLDELEQAVNDPKLEKEVQASSSQQIEEQKMRVTNYENASAVSRENMEDIETKKAVMLDQIATEHTERPSTAPIVPIDVEPLLSISNGDEVCGAPPPASDFIPPPAHDEPPPSPSPPSVPCNGYDESLCPPLPYTKQYTLVYVSMPNYNYYSPTSSEVANLIYYVLIDGDQTDETQLSYYDQSANAYVEVAGSNDKTLVMGACGVALGFACQDLLSCDSINDASDEMESSKQKEAALLAQIVRSLMRLLCQLCPCVSKSLQNLSKFRPCPWSRKLYYWHTEHWESYHGG